MSWINSKVNPRMSMAMLRAVMLASFALMVAATVWSMLDRHKHMLHIAHVAFAILTFLLIALYLARSAEIASLTARRELRLRLAVDASYMFVELMREGSPVFNACTGALAKSGIYVKAAPAMAALAKLTTVAAYGNTKARDGYAATKVTLAEMGIELSDDPDACPVRIMLGPFDPADGTDCDFVLTHDKVAHMLKAVYISRLYVGYTRLTRVLLASALAVAAGLIAIGQAAYAGAAVAMWAAGEVAVVRAIEKRTAHMSFKTVAQKAPFSGR